VEDRSSLLAEVFPVSRARLVGLNHIALEVADIDDALGWYGQFFEFALRGRSGSHAAFVDMGDQFIALMAGRRQSADDRRHFGLVVDDKERVRAGLRDAGVEVAATGSLDFLDPWGNHVQVVDYRDIQFTKAPSIMRGMGLAGLEKSAAAQAEIARKGAR
jgi:lactoylglutathione lyase